MKILISSDWHLSENPRDAYRWEFQKWLRSTVQELNIDAVYMLGDLTEAKDHHSAWLVNSIVDNIYALSKLCNVVILCGNHDKADADQPFFAFTSRLKNVLWVDAPTAYLRCWFLPHTDNYKRDWGTLIERTPSRIFYCHNTFDGAFENNRELHGIPTDIFPRNSVVYSGDIHTPQTLGPVTYVGAPYLIDYGDSYIPRVIILDREETKSIPFQTKSIPVPGPNKRLFIWGSEQTDINVGDILKVRVHFTSKNSDQWWKTRDAIHLWAQENSFIIDSIEPIIEYNKIKESVNPEKYKDDETLIKNYAKQHGMDERTLQVGLNVLK